MKKAWTLLPAAVIFLLAGKPKKKITIWLAGDSTIAIKEQRVYPETGWGMPFAYFWDSTVSVRNLAKNGRSTKTFRSEGHWQKIVDNAQDGDYVFIQFGHNDEAVEKKERYAPPDSFKLNLRAFIHEVRQKKAIPVLITPVSRRKFDKEGKAAETHRVYSALTTEVASAEKTVLIDLDTKSRELYQQYGPEFSKLLFLQLEPGEHPNYPNGRNDNTHFSELGARKIAQIVLKDIRAQLPELAERIVEGTVK
ncbi:MAG TPA: rhamnogalacturonan acetylesterase [Chitinophagaceae bacterium]|nr:rhamnogalacturonan acetylesterase [Chitinophagaceae bacterium]